MLSCFQVYKGTVAAVAVMGVVVGLFAALAAGLTHCKSISDNMVDGTSHLQFKDHSKELGYQHEVRAVRSWHICLSTVCLLIG
jgi:hypothetical protein